MDLKLRNKRMSLIEAILWSRGYKKEYNCEYCGMPEISWYWVRYEDLPIEPLHTNFHRHTHYRACIHCLSMKGQPLPDNFLLC